MKAVHFGAGKIGRGFIGDLLYDSAYEITFIDVNEKLNKELNEYHNYYLYVIEDGYSKKEIGHVCALSPVTQADKVTDAIIEADLLTTAVLADNFPKIARSISLGLKARLDHGKERIDLIPCENALMCGDLLKKEILNEGILSEEELDRAVAITNTAVDRMVFDVNRDGRNGIEVGKAYELVIDSSKLKNPQVIPIQGAVYTDNLQKYLERKLYVINGGHAWSGYMAHIMGFKTIQEYFADSSNVEMSRNVMLEIGALLESKYGFTHKQMVEYIEFALNRFLTPGVTDYISRISRAPIRKLGPNDRLVGPAMQCAEKGLPNELLLKGIAAVFLFDEKEDEQSVELQDYVNKNGIEKAITNYTNIQPGTEEFHKIVTFYKAMK